MKVFKVLLTMVLSFSLFGCGSSSSNGDGALIEEGILKVGVAAEYPPFEYMAEDGVTPMGFDIDLANAIGEKLGVEVQFVNTAWDGIFDGLNTNRYDVVISGVTVTEERQGQMNFSDEYLGNAQAIVTLADDTTVSSFEDLDGLKVGYQAETTSDVALTKFIEENSGMSISVSEYDMVMNAYADLASKRVDAVVSDSLVAVDYLKDAKYRLAFQGPAEELIAVALKQGNEDLTAQVNDALTQLYDDGTLVELSNTWFGIDVVSSVR
ncbi:MAG: transporter substrate-binding domain-containing protein [Erysipelotrichaceae bacterium]|nr:transporter substrate-binding domain-containing protein [Erysipelotrichaceae bacterium]MDD3809955.1 transporter substrate-binding domain-containing protein [Erysipelotrichaceae bacterium]